MSEAVERNDGQWPLRPWLLAAICASAGIAFDLLTRFGDHVPVSPVNQALAVFVAVASVSLAITLEQRRWPWALAFALGWGVVVALVGWFTARYNHLPNIFEMPFLAGVAAVLLAAPLFQAARDEGQWRFGFERVLGHGWNDAVIGAASLGFVAVTFLMSWLIAGLFRLIGIDLVKQLLQQGWFAWMLAGLAFGGAAGMLRERDALVATLQRLVMVVLSVLAPVLAAALTLFLLSLPFTGLGGLWNAAIPATPLMLVASGGAVLLANAVIGNGGHDSQRNPVLRLAAMALVVAVLPLAVIAAASLGQRVGQYGWTPERMWAAVAVAVALAYGAIGWWAVASRRAAFDDALRPLQVRLALGLCALLLLLAMPIMDFGAISADSQIARLASGRVAADRFDWQAMAFDFGPAGRRRLAEIAHGGPPDQRRQAAAALGASDRFAVAGDVEATRSEAMLDGLARLVPAGATLTPALRRAISRSALCRAAPCVVALIAPDRTLLAGPVAKGGGIRSATLARDASGSWTIVDPAPPLPSESFKPDLGRASVGIARVSRRVLVIDGQAVGAPFE